MTSYFRNYATCWRRRISTDDYDEQSEWHCYRNDNIDPDSYLNNVVSKFKHEIFALALGVSPYEDQDTKSIYLYVGGFRFIKASFSQPNILKIEFRNDEMADVYRNCNESLAPGRWPKLKKKYYKHFKQLQYFPCGYYYWGYFLYQKKKVKVCEDQNTEITADEMDRLVMQSGYV